jgi:hypothetical protein
VNVRFDCPVCERPGRLDLPGPGEWQCPSCDHLLRVPPGAATEPVPACLVCGNPELYRKKDFPHQLGLAILTVACLASVIPYWLYQPKLVWAILLGTAAFDGLLYLWVGDVSVCYRCGAQYRGFPPGPEHKPFELGTGERYRQERLRREQLRLTAEGAEGAEKRN